MARAALSMDVETLPEADRLESFPHPRETSQVFGHRGAEDVLAAGLSSDRMHHAWLICGAEGVGKATLAYRFARAALHAKADADGDGFGFLDEDVTQPSATLDVPEGSIADRQVLALSHPGLLVIRRGYDVKAKRFSSSISVDDVRRLKSFLQLSAAGDGRRVVIVDSADELNMNAANALLKSLEEPPPRTIFLLLTAAPGRLLATIRSRCRRMVLQPLAEDDVRHAIDAAFKAMDRNVPHDVDWAALTRMANGSVRRALALIDGGGLALNAKIDAMLVRLPRLDGKALHALADELQGTAAEAKYELYCSLLETSLARLIRAEATGQGADSERQLAARLIGPARLATFAELWETLARDRRETDDLNLDRKAFITGTWMRLKAASAA